MADGIQIKADVGDVLAALRDLRENYAPYVLATALTKTAVQIQRVEYSTMGEVLDRPTRFTMNSLYVQPATKDKLGAVVEFKDGFGSVPAWRYLGPQVAGGARRHKSHEKRLIAAGLMRTNEFAVPGSGIALDGSGNIPGGTLQRILSQVQAQADPQQNATAKSLKRQKRKGLGRYFVLRGKGRAPAGIYWRQGARSMVPVIVFVRAPRYQTRFPFYEVGRNVFEEAFLPNARAAWASIVSRFKKAA